MTNRKVLFDHKWLRVVELNGWFAASEPAASKDNLTVAVLPFRKVREDNTKDTIFKNQFLSRFERNPAHMTDLLHQVSIITGACETGNPLYHAQQELKEEGGYDIPQERFRFMGEVCPMKASCSRLHLYSVRIFNKDEQVDPTGDGSIHEQKEYVSWVSRETMLAAKDPYIHTIMLRAGL